MSFKRIIYSILILILMAVSAVLYFTPYKEILEKRIVEEIESRGIMVSEIQIDSINDSEIILSKLYLGEESSIKLHQIKVAYNVKDIVFGKVDSFEVERVDLSIESKGSNWVVGGLQGNQPSPKQEGLNLPELFNLLPFEINLKEVNLKVLKDGISAPLKLNFKMKKDSSGKKAEGSLRAAKIKLENSPLVLPKLDFITEFRIEDSQLVFNADLGAEKSSVGMESSGQIDLSNPGDGVITVSNVKIPYGDGFFIIDEIKSPICMCELILINIKLKSINLTKLLAEDASIKGEGPLSGNISISRQADGEIRINSGELHGDDSGVIHVDGSLIPGDNQQVQMTRDVLQNFNYDILDISIKSGENEKSAILMKIEGRNPDYMGGCKVKLNVNLTGDTIPMIKKSLLPINDVKKLIEANERDEK